MSALSKEVGKAHRAAHKHYDNDRPRMKFKKPNQSLKSTDLVAFNQEAEPAAILLISGILKHEGRITYKNALREIAFEVGISTMTAQRYLERHLARRAEFKLEDGFLILRSKK